MSGQPVKMVDVVTNHTHNEIDGVSYMSQKNIVLNYLANGNRINAGVARKLGVSNLGSVVHRLRQEGNPIYLNKTSFGNHYRLGSPTKSMIASAYRNYGASVFGG